MGTLPMVLVFCLFAQLYIVVNASDYTDYDKRTQEAVFKYLQMRDENDTLDEPDDIDFQTINREVRSEFICPPLAPSPSVPTSVHKLRPGDIKVIAAIGDSLTAGRGIEGKEFGLLVDYRGRSWCIGGDNDYYKTVTLPNILRKYNPNLYGYSESINLLKPRFNVAVSGAKSRDVLGQARNLYDKMKADRNINFEKDWKVITVFIGGNDLCDWCEDVEEYSSAKYRENLKALLDYLDSNFPRTFVNLVEVLKIEFVTKMKQNLFCQIIIKAVCDCGAFPKTHEDEEKLIRLREEYQAVARELASSPEYQTRNDFAVVLQPFYRNTTVPTKANGDVDLSYFAADCFHQSKKGHTAAAEALWNNMIEPIGSKRTSWSPGEYIECPTEENPFFYTHVNSRRRRRP